MGELATVLLVEDNEDNRVIYTMALRHHGYRVFEAADGEEALAIVELKKPDLILLDISLPKMDGWAVVQTLRADTATRHIPIIALTAHAFKEDRARGKEAGCDDYLVKPVEPRTVVAVVRRFLGK